MDELKTLIGIRNTRLEDAERRVYSAMAQLTEAQMDLQKKETRLEEYVLELPKLVDDIYLTIMGKKADVKTVEEAVMKEKKLYVVKDDYTLQVKQAVNVVGEKEKAVLEAQQHRQKEEIRRDGLVDVKKDYDKELKIEVERRQSKQLDDLATIQFTRKHN